MSWYRWLTCATLLGIVESTWLYLLLGLSGFVAGVGHAPLPLMIVSAVLVMGLVTRAVHDLIPDQWRLRAVLPRCLMFAVAWIAIGSARGTDNKALGLAWPYELLTSSDRPPTLVFVAFTFLVVALLWQHGKRRGGTVAGTAVIARSFRAGLVVFTLLLAFEAAGDLDLGTRVAMGPFFVASLFGMALARAPTHGVRLHIWLALIVAAIVFIFLAGLALALLAVAIVRGGFAALSEVWLELARAVNRSVSETLVELLGERETTGMDLSGAVVEPSQAMLLLVLLLGLAVFAVLLHRLLNAPPPIELPNIVLDLGSAEREAIEDQDTDVAGQLLERLLPRWPWRRHRDGAAHVLPAHPGLARVYVLYYELLERARTSGIVINPAHTPRERIASLRGAFPKMPVQRLTEAFEAACYGAETPPPSELQRLGEQCDSADA